MCFFILTQGKKAVVTGIMSFFLKIVLFFNGDNDAVIMMIDDDGDDDDNDDNDDNDDADDNDNDDGDDDN